MNLGALGLTDRDEGSNAEAAREMVANGDWLTPTMNGSPRFAKPVFLYWLIAGSYLAFGVNEFAARFPSALFGSALVLMQYGFAVRFFGRAIGLRAAIMLLLNFEIVMLGRMVITDMVLTFFTTFSIFSFFLAMWGTGRAKRWYWGFYVGMALATLTKGPPGFLIPLIVVIPYLVLTKQWRDVLRECRPVTGALVFLILAVPWYLTMYELYGYLYTTSIRGDTIGRFTTSVGAHHGTFLFYIPVLLVGFFPWSGFLPLAMIESLRGARSLPSGRSQEYLQRQLLVFCGAWTLAVLVFFTLSATRLPHYIAPLFPAAALLVASAWDRFLSSEANRWARYSLWFTLLVGSCLGIAFIGVDWAYEHFNSQIVLEFPAASKIDPGWAPTAIGFLVLGAMGLFGYAAVTAERPGLSFAVASSLMIGMMLLITTVTLPRFNRYFIAPEQELAAVAGLNLERNDTLVSFGLPKPSLLFYARLHCGLTEYFDPCLEMIKPGQEDRLMAVLIRPGQMMILTQERLVPKLPPSAAAFHQVLSRHGYVLLARYPVL